MKTFSRISLILLLFVVCLLLPGCCKPANNEAVETEQALTPPPPPPPPPPKPEPQPTSDCGPYTVSSNYPYGSKGIVKLENKMPKEVALNATFEHTIQVTNLTDVMLTDVVVTENVSQNFKYVESKPKAQESASNLMWRMASLGPQEVREITIVGIATGTDCLRNCATVTYTVPVCANVKVVEPKFDIF